MLRKVSVVARLCPHTSQYVDDPSRRKPADHVAILLGSAGLKKRVPYDLRYNVDFLVLILVTNTVLSLPTFVVLDDVHLLIF